MRGEASNYRKRTNATHHPIESELTHSRTRRCYLSCYSTRQPNRLNHSRSQTLLHSSPHQQNGGGAGRARTLTRNSYLVRHSLPRQTRTSHNRRNRRHRK
jgi:hypothetical protein